jgi:hypothetical protein
MNRNSLGVVSGAGAGAERSGGERSEPQRSGAPVPTEAPPAASHPDPEVVARPQRRSYTAEYKVRILREAEADRNGFLAAIATIQENARTTEPLIILGAGIVGMTVKHGWL